MTDKDVIRMALNTLLLLPSSGWIPGSTERTLETIQTLRAALAQPKKEWVGLTNEDVADIDAKAIGIRSAMYLAEVKLKDKNSG
jgi:hypothetical protein